MLTEHDRETIAREYRSILDTIDDYDGPEIIVLSIGYCHLWSDGEVTAHGRIIATCDDSGTVTEPSDDDDDDTGCDGCGGCDDCEPPAV